MFLHLRDNSDLFDRSARVLHFAPERALGATLAGSPRIEYVSTDLEMPGVSIKMDICDLLFRDEVFDCVICSHVLEHIPDDGQAIKEIRRVLNRDGFAMILVPNLNPPNGVTYEDFSIDTPEGRERAFGQGDHVRIYGADLVDRLASHGFSVDTFTPGRDLPAQEVSRFGIDRNERIYICTPKDATA